MDGFITRTQTHPSEQSQGVTCILFGFALAWYFSQVRKLFGKRKPAGWQVIMAGAMPILVAVVLLVLLPAGNW